MTESDYQALIRHPRNSFAMIHGHLAVVRGPLHDVIASVFNGRSVITIETYNDGVEREAVSVVYHSVPAIADGCIIVAYWSHTLTLSELPQERAKAVRVL